MVYINKNKPPQEQYNHLISFYITVQTSRPTVTRNEMLRLPFQLHMIWCLKFWLIKRPFQLLSDRFGTGTGYSPFRLIVVHGLWIYVVFNISVSLFDTALCRCAVILDWNRTLNCSFIFSSQQLYMCTSFGISQCLRMWLSLMQLSNSIRFFVMLEQVPSRSKFLAKDVTYLTSLLIG